MTELAPGPDRPPWRAGACARTPADEKVSLPRELERQKRALEQAYRDLARKVQTVEKRAKQLAKARSPVQLMGGESSADAAAEDATPPAVDRDFVLRGRILLAEDTPDIQRLIAFYLRKAGAEVTEAQDGLRACELATEAAASGTP